MMTKTTQDLAAAAAAARKEEALARDNLERIIARRASESLIVRGGHRLQLASSRLGEAEKALADAKGKALDGIVFWTTVVVAAAFATFVTISAYCRVGGTGVVASITAPNVRLVIGEPKLFPLEVGVRRVSFGPVTMLGRSDRPAEKTLAAAYIIVDGRVTLTNFNVPAGTVARLVTENGFIGFYPERAIEGSLDVPLVTFTIEVDAPATITIDEGSTVSGPELLPLGTRLSVTVDVLPGGEAGFQIGRPEPWSLELSTSYLSFEDATGESSIIEGTLEVPSVAKSVQLHRHDGLVVGADASLVGSTVLIV